MLNNKIEKLISVLLLAITAVVGINAAGPLNMWNNEQRIPYRWSVSSPVQIYTDLGPFEIVPNTIVPISNETADGVVAFSANEWSTVPTSSFRAQVVGDFGMIGLPDINDAATAALVFGPDNGGGLHVIYDAVPSGTAGQGKIMKDFFGAPPTVLGIASPEFADETTGIITEGWMILNSQQRWVGDDQLLNFAGVFTHEMGHAINLAHSQTNGAIYFSNDTRGPKSCTTLPYPTVVTKNDVETMYPFANVKPVTGNGVEQSTVEQSDDNASISNLYPSADYRQSTGSISGRILQTDGQTGITGVNVIARNLSDPYVDAVSAMSGDFVRVAAGNDGSYTLTGLTPGAQYAVYTDLIVRGGFPTQQPLYVPEGEEFYNGASESGNGVTDDRCHMEPITAIAGVTTTADIVLNTVKGAPKFTPMYPGLFPRSLSTDGRVVGGGVDPGGTYRWTEESGYVVLNQTFGADSFMSRDGLSFVSNTLTPAGKNIASTLTLGPNQAWLQLPLPVAVPPGVTQTTCSSGISSASRISADGRTVTGLAYTDTNGPLPGQTCKARPFVWTAEGGSVALPVAANLTGNARTNGVSNDRRTIAGWHDTFGQRQAVRWIDGQFELFSTPTFPVGEAQYVTPDVRMITGGNAGTVQNPWKWTREGGLVEMPRVAPNFSAYANAASDDGKVVAGLGGSRSQFPGDNAGQRAFLWTQELGSVDFEDFLIAQGTFFEGWILYSTASMSADGTIQAGAGINSYGGAGWLVDMTKVNICHAPPGNPRNTQSINVPFVGAMADHLKHGDTIGFCTDN
jgi:hypothetical protein